MVEMLQRLDESNDVRFETYRTALKVVDLQQAMFCTFGLIRILLIEACLQFDDYYLLF